MRNLQLPAMNRIAMIVGAVGVALALVVGYVGLQLYNKLTHNTIVAYFPNTPALYPGD